MRIPLDNPLSGHGAEKYGADGLLVSSADRGWSGLIAELRRHDDGVIAWKNEQADTEICVNVDGSGSVITRRGGGITNRTVAQRGTIWLTPAGLREDEVDISTPVGILHLYLPPSQFSPDNLGDGVDRSVLASLRYESGVRDPLVAEIAYAILAELQSETSSGRLLAETLACGLAARLVQKHAGPSSSPAMCSARKGIDRRRLARVLDYIEANLERDLTIDCLASIACLSRYHFARTFKAAVGQSPHRYVGVKRLERAKTMLEQGDQPLADIALALKFSCQPNFTRAFRQATGQTPAQYRRSFST